MDEQLARLSEMLDRAGRVAFLGGAGLSTESGIPDFRSSNGVYAALRAYGKPPEELLSHGFFLRHTEVFFDYYRKYLICPEAEPNPAHRALARLEQRGKLTAVITQNIDGLHQKAGSRHVLELHGSVYRNHCMACGGIIKPDVVLYGEGLDPATLSAAVQAVAQADMLLIGGTQLSVYPAAGLVDYFHGRDLAVINLSATPRDAQAALTIRRPIGEVLAAVVP